MALLNVTYVNLMNAVGNFLGFGTDYTAYSAANQTRCDDIVKDGLRRFYYYTGMVDDVMFTGWSFMNPTATISLVSGTRTYTLATDFGDIDGTFTWGDGDTKPPILLVSEENIRALYSAQDATGDPVFAAVKAATSDGTAQQTYTVTFFPEPDLVDTLTYRYFADPLVLTASVLYPLGGPKHAQTIKEACLAQAELVADDEVGIHSQTFDRLLANSVRADRIALTPEFLGKNVDRSDIPFQLYRY